MGKECKVSVIIPVYNAGKYLEKCLSSIINQTLKDIEIICVDDGSTDDSKNILRRFESKDDRVIVIEQENTNAGAARNKGLAAAKGDYLVFLDADDFFETDLLELQYKKCVDHSADLCICAADRYDEKEKKYKKAKAYLNKKMIEKEPFNRTHLKKKIFQVTNPAPWNKMFSSNFVRTYEIEFQSLPRANDVYFTLTSLALAERIVTVDKELVHYRINASTDSQIKNNAIDPLAFCKALQAVKQRLTAEGIFVDVEKSFANCAFEHCVFNLRKFNTDAEIYDMILENIRDKYYDDFRISDLNETDVSDPAAYKYLRARLKSLEDPKLMIADKIDTFSDEESEALVSVIIPVYNVEPYLRECLDSVINQSYANIEIICVDDGSTDASPEILREYSETDNRIRIITQENKGLSAARNVGFKHALGEYIIYLDSDDMLSLDAVETLYHVIKPNDLDSLFFDFERVFEDDYVDNRKLGINERQTFSRIYNGIDLLTLFRNENSYITSAHLMMIKREFLLHKGINFYDGILHEDELFCFHIYMNAERVSHINRKLYFRRHRKGSIMASNITHRNVEGYFISMVEMMKYGLSDTWDKEKALEIARYQNVMQWAAKDRYSRISEEERALIEFADPFKQILFERLVIKEYAYLEKNKEIKRKKAEIDKLKRKIASIRRSNTYRAGRLLTFIPRKIKKILKGKKIVRNYDYYAALEPSKYKKELKLWYKSKTGETLNLMSPKTFNEKIQWLKLYDSTPLKTQLADKYLVRDWVAEKIGQEYLIPLLGVWDDFDEIDFEQLPDKFVLKANHGCGWNIIVENKDTLNVVSTKRKMDSWLKQNYAYYGLEFHYRNIAPRIIAEKYIENIDRLYDYKVMCFGGKAEFVWVDSDRYDDHRRTLYSPDWERLNVEIGIPSSDREIPKPNNLDKMLRFAEVLSEPFSHARIDFYEVGDRLYFGEITFTSGNGKSRIKPEEYGRYMGDLIKLPKKNVMQ